MRHNLRHLRVFLAVAETASVTRAAEAVRVSQPAVTQALSRLEAMLGAALFTRTPHGLFLNPAGEVFRRRAARVFAILDPVLNAIAPRLRLTVTAAQIEALIAVRDTENISLAARQLGLAQPTVHRAVAQLEEEAGRALFERTARGTLATRLGHSLAQAARLALSELSQAQAELAELRAEATGKIVIGAMPLSRSHILPTAIVRFQQERPLQTIQVTEGAYAELLSGLRHGEIDFLIGALRHPAPVDDIEQVELFQDTAMMIARVNHPIFQSASPTLTQLAHYPWIVSAPSTPIRDHFDRLFADNGLAPRQLVETGSLILMREILSQTDYLGFTSGGQARAEVARGLVREIGFDLSTTRRPIGITTRVGWMPTPAQQQLIDTIQSLV
ncbi:LysR family transcriptional regulator [Rhizobium sp. C4]|uniref:LysR family transcriptional regulator n=1 Tax=Rhizobium sp. C4 TaxID=1349800 RepID=UPI001E2C8B04|nr:LysR family transcriptional regulator [Rhizobium sp. C4]MCD2172152.1 LysR family transcriptional regulator [Rhizobium sp. C4]